VGNLLFLLGLIVVIMSIIAFAQTPEDQPVTGGIYKLLRHPYYVGSYLSLIAIGLICREWFILVLTLVSIVPGLWSAKWEEQHCEEAYGGNQVEYEQRR
jgi:protein-S-isoprenylcysteine O-methyltransferase Ste14